MSWSVSTKGDRAGCALADRHYSRRSVGAPQFMPPGQTLVLIGAAGLAVFGWWRPDPASGLRAMNGLNGWTCTIFRNEDPRALSSELILQAERELAARHDCGPDGMLTYVDVRKVRSTNPGFCFQAAGWRKAGWNYNRTKRLLQKPFRFAGVGR